MVFDAGCCGICDIPAEKLKMNLFVCSLLLRSICLSHVTTYGRRDEMNNVKMYQMLSLQLYISSAYRFSYELQQKGKLVFASRKISSL